MSLFGLFDRFQPIAQCPAWRPLLAAVVGGLSEVGLSTDEQRLLVVSYAGRGLFDLKTGQLVARDDEAPSSACDWLDRDGHRVRGMGAAGQEWFDAVGLWGGELASRSDAEGSQGAPPWTVEVRGSGRSEQALVGRIGEPQRWLVSQPLGEIRAFGFSASGRLLLLATSSDVSLYAQTRP